MDQRFSIIKANARIWAFSSIHSNYKRLKVLHQVIAGAVSAGDYFVYMGNIIGVNDGAEETFAEILRFKSEIQNKYPSITNENFIFLRGKQEEMWQKMLYIHLSDKDDKVYDYLLKNGAEGILNSYGFNKEDGFNCIEKGVVVTSNWTEKIRETFYKSVGYKDIFLNLKHAAFIENNSMLFVNSGINHNKTLEQHKDEFWWHDNNFIQEKSFQNYSVVVRGYSSLHNSGIYQDEYYITANSKDNKEKQEPLYALFFNEKSQLDKGIEV